MQNLVKSYHIEEEDFRIMQNPMAYQKLSQRQNASSQLHGLISAQALVEMRDKFTVSDCNGQTPTASGARRSSCGVLRMATNSGYACRLDWSFLNDDGLISKLLSLHYYKLDFGNYVLHGQPEKFEVEPGVDTKTTFWIDELGVKRNSEELTKEIFDKLNSFA